MITAASIAIGVLYVLGTLYVVYRLFAEAKHHERALSQGLKALEDEILSKKNVIEEIANLKQSLCQPEEYAKIKEEVGTYDEKLRVERGRVTITEAELDALETRLREMEEIERELQASSVEYTREVDMLKTQESGLAERALDLRKQLDRSLGELDRLLVQIGDSVVAKEKITEAKTQVLQIQDKVEWYRQEFANVNEKYLLLKKAYDALDIEYAQLYEKQNELEAARAKQQ